MSNGPQGGRPGTGNRRGAEEGWKRADEGISGVVAVFEANKELKLGTARISRAVRWVSEAAQRSLLMGKCSALDAFGTVV